MSAPERVRMLYAEWLDAAASRDEPWFLEHLAEDFLYIGLGGGTMDRGELIAANNLGENGAYALLSLEARDLGGLWQAFGTYSARCDIPEEVPVGDEMRRKYRDGCTLAFTNLWRPAGDRFVCVSHATVILD